MYTHMDFETVFSSKTIQSTLKYIYIFTVYKAAQTTLGLFLESLMCVCNG